MIATLLATLLLVLVPLAEATPPDQTWLPGLYDNADFDDVIGFVTEATATVEDVPAATLRPQLVVAPDIPGITLDPYRGQPRAPYGFRGPPSA